MRILSFIFFVFSGLGLFGQGIEFEASAPSVVEVGEQFRLVYSLNRKGMDLQVPAMDGFERLMGPSVGSSTSISIINGTTTQSVSYTYTYVLEGVKEGTYRIPAATVKVEGKEVHSNELSVQVVKGSEGNASTGGGQGNRQGGGGQTVQPDARATVNESNLFVKVDVSRRNVYIGECIEATIKVYSKVDLQRFGRSKFPSFDGFLAEEINTPAQIELVRENYDGKVYNVGIIRKLLLFPQHTGELTIEPFELECIVRQQLTNSRSFFDDFFGNYRDVRTMRMSKPVKVNVKELPTDNRPLGFTGAVGNLSMRTSVSRDTVNANDAITYKIVLQGTGNLKLIEAPKLNFPPDFESYDPKVNKDIHTGANGMSGTVTFEYLLIPRYAGDYTIPSANFSFFDPNSSRYRMIGGNEYKVHVLKGHEAVGGDSSGMSNAAVQSFKKEEVRQLGRDIRYIHTGGLDLRAKGGRFFGTMGYAMALLVPFVLFVVGMILNRRRLKANADMVRVKNKAANKMARRRMNAAGRALKGKNTELFYDEVLKAMWGYVSYKLNVDGAELNRDNITDILQEKSVDGALIQEFIGVLDTCELVRYAPGGDPENTMDKIYADGVAVITKLDKAIR